MQNDSAPREIRWLGRLFLASLILHVLGSVALGVLASKGISIPIELNLVFSELTLLIPAFIYILIGNYGFRNDLGFRPIKVGTVLMCVLLFFLVNPIASFVNVVSQLFTSNQMVSMSDTLLSGSNAMVLFLAAIYGPFCEEFLFRSLFNKRYELYVGPMRAALISALYFALMHFNLNQAAYAFVLGFIFSIVNKAANSVYPSIIIHVLINGFNFLLLFIFGKMHSGADIAATAEMARNSDLIYVMIGSTLVVAIVAGLIALPCVIWIAKNEGGYEGLCDMFTAKHPRVNWLTVSAILSILFVLFMMFGLDPLMKALKVNA